MSTKYSTSVLRRLRCQVGVTDGEIEKRAMQMHADYRAAFKALSGTKPTRFYRTSNLHGNHDHGWMKCHCKDYFRRRAALLIIREAVASSEASTLLRSGPMDFFLKVKELSFEGKTSEEIAFILGTDVGRVRIVLAGGDDPESDSDNYEVVDQDIDEDDEDLDEERGVQQELDKEDDI